MATGTLTVKTGMMRRAARSRKISLKNYLQWNIARLENVLTNDYKHNSNFVARIKKILKNEKAVLKTL